MEELLAEADGQRRQRQEERSAGTQKKLLAATFKILRELGHAGLRSASVAREAGVSIGGLLHQYPTKEVLIAAVHANIVETMDANSRERIQASDDEELLEAIVADARDRFLGDSFKVMLDILIASGQEEPVARAVEALGRHGRLSVAQGWADRLAATGVESRVAEQVTLFLWNMVKGLAVRNLVRPDTAHVDRVVALGLALARRRCRTNAKTSEADGKPA